MAAPSARWCRPRSRRWRSSPSWAKANPAKANCGNPGEGSFPHFLTLVMAKALGAPIQPVPYRGGAPALADMMAGQLAALMLPDGSFLPYTKDNRARVLATSGEKRSPFYPDVATFAEQGVKELVVTEWFGLFAPAATPAAVVSRASDAIAKALASKEIAQAFANLGMVPKSNTPAELAHPGRRFGLDQGGELGRRIGLRHHAEIGEGVGDLLAGERLGDGVGGAGHDGGRRRGRRKQAEPFGDDDLLHALLGEGGDVGIERRALLAAGRQDARAVVLGVGQERHRRAASGRQAGPPSCRRAPARRRDRAPAGSARPAPWP